MSDSATKYNVVGTRPIRPDGVGKVTGRDRFGADMAMPGQLTGLVLRSPHAHARIKSIRTSKAEALAGVKAVATAADLSEIPSEEAFVGEGPMNFRDLSDNTLARRKVLYDGHAVAAVAATSEAIAQEALDLIEVDYEILPHVIDVEDAMKAGAPILHDDLFTGGVEPTPTTASNVAKKVEFKLGDLEAGFAKAEVVVEGRYTTKPVHQGYIEPHACVVSTAEDGQILIWSSSQGQFMVRAYTAKLLGCDLAQIRAMPAEIGGGFGGKTLIYLEVVAAVLSRKSGRPVKMVMTRQDVFRGSGPAAGGVIEVKLGATKAGKITAAYAMVKLQAGAYPGSPVGPACMCAFAPYDIENVAIDGYDVVTNRPKVAAYRAPGAPNAAFGVESALDELAGELGIDPLKLRMQNAAREGTKAAYGPRFPVIGCVESMQAARDHDHLKVELGPNQGRGVASGFWFNIGGESSASINIAEDGTVVVATGNPDIGGSRASMAMMAAEVLGIDVAQVRPIIADTSSVGYCFLTGGSRVTFATGMAVVNAANKAVDELRNRAAKIWDVDVEGVIWEDGHAKPASTNVGDMDPMSLADIALMSGKTGGPIGTNDSVNATGAGAAFATHVVDVEVDPETGYVEILRYTATQDVGTAIHPSYVEGQIQGGVVQGIGWALNEEYVYDDNGRLDNASFLDYRVPVASDLPMIDAVVIEVPNPRHPYGVRGVGEVPIVPPMAAVANAIAAATGKRMRDLPMSPPKIVAALES